MLLSELGRGGSWYPINVMESKTFQREIRKNRVISWADFSDGKSFKNPVDEAIQAWQWLYFREE